MAFHPVVDTPLEHHAPTPAVRQLRLYQASFLLRDYGFQMEEMPFEASGCLPLDKDPKQAWADANLRQCPMEINTAEREQLLRVPGIGPKGAEAILRARRQRCIRDLTSLRRLGIHAERVAPFVLMDGRRMASQPTLF
jgi:predicted DNA-binding helix-hairpin-helix protein